VRSRQRQLFWLALNFLVSEGHISTGKALRYFDSEEKLFQPEPAWLDSLRLGSQAREKLISSQLREQAEAELEKLEEKEYTLLTFDDDRYPPLLREIVEPPLVLYCAGRPEVLSWAAVAIVGSRKPTSYGRVLAEQLAEELAATGLTVVSGLARGVDTAAHRGALRTGLTVAVLGSGLERVYPKENKMLAEKIVEKGALVSEFPLTSEPLGHHFPLRNRIISGLSLGCLVVEAGLRSGALITARLAADQGREVMAVPGRVDSDLSRGPHLLIKQGARLVESAEDLLLELPSPWKEVALERLNTNRKTVVGLEGREKLVYDALPESSLIHIDELADKMQIAVAELLVVLLSLEMKELVVQEAGKFFRRRG